MARAIGVNEFLAKKFTWWELAPEWKNTIGKVAANFTMIVWGDSGNGKTRFVLNLCKALAQFGKIAFDCTEEGISLTMQEAFIEVNMKEITGKILLIDREPYSELVERLSKPKSPNIVVINSIQHMRLTYEQWKELKNKFRKKAFILVSHANGKEPRGSAAQDIRYDVDIKLYVKNYVAYPMPSRYGGNNPMILWPDAAVIDPRFCLKKQVKPAQPAPNLFTDTPATAPEMAK